MNPIFAISAPLSPVDYLSLAQSFLESLGILGAIQALIIVYVASKALAAAKDIF